MHEAFESTGIPNKPGLRTWTKTLDFRLGRLRTSKISSIQTNHGLDIQHLVYLGDVSRNNVPQIKVFGQIFPGLNACWLKAKRMQYSISLLHWQQEELEQFYKYSLMPGYSSASTKRIIIWLKNKERKRFDPAFYVCPQSEKFSRWQWISRKLGGNRGKTEVTLFSSQGPKADIINNV